MKIIGIGLIVLVLFFIQQSIYKRLWDKNLYVSVSFAQKGIIEGEKGEVHEVVENRKHLPLNMLKVKFQTSRNLGFVDDKSSKTTDQYYRNDIFQIGGGEKITRKLSFVGKKRGYYHINNIDLVGSDLFLSTEMYKSQGTSCYLYVYPKTFDTREFRLSLQKLNGEILVKRHLLEDPFEYRGIREYQPIDDIRSVNWKATAKTGELKVNQKNYTAMQTIRIYLNVEDKGILKKDAEVETSMQIVMGLAEFYLKQGIKVACYANGKDVITGESMSIGGGAGIGQQDVIGKALARINTEDKPWSFAELFEDNIIHDAAGTVTLFVSANGYPDYLKVLERCRQSGVEFTWFYPCYSGEEPEVPEMLKEHVEYVRLRR